MTLWINSRSGARDADLAGLDGARVIAGRIPNKILNARLALAGRPHLDTLVGDPDWFILPNPNFAAFSSRAKVAVVFHDLSFEVNPSWFSPRQRVWHRMVNPRALAERADRIIAVSENTKRDLIDLYGEDEGKIFVVPPAIAPGQYPQIKREQVILFLGEVTRRKNVLGLVKAFEGLAGSFPELILIIAGPDGWGAGEVDRAIQASPVGERIRRMGAVTEETKRKLLSWASVFVYPSFYEGFGLPVVEAMAAGTPVVASHAGSLPEVVGDAGLLVDPYDLSTLREAMAALLGNPSLAESCARRGLERAAAWASPGEPARLLACLRM